MHWNWNEEKTQRWLCPADGMDALAKRWLSLGFRTMLDRGCGPGRHSILFAQQGFTVTAMDLSGDVLDYLASWAGELQLSLSTIQGDMFHMPFPDDAFDCVLDYNVSYHTDTAGYRQAVSELHRILRPGGEAYLTIKSQNDPDFIYAPPEAHIDRYTLAGNIPHFYLAESDIPDIFPGFSLSEPVREVRAPGLDNPKESIHYHLLIRKDDKL